MKTIANGQHVVAPLMTINNIVVQEEEMELERGLFVAQNVMKLDNASAIINAVTTAPFQDVLKNMKTVYANKNIVHNQMQLFFANAIKAMKIVMSII